MKKQFAKGYKAALYNTKSSKNPHKEGTKRYFQWDDGWISGFVELCIVDMGCQKKPRRRIPVNRKMRSR